MNWKVILIGGLAYYVTAFILSMATGPIIHDGILDAAYRATPEFWRPELNLDPPDMKTLMPMWIFNGLIGAFVISSIFSWIRSAFQGPGWRQGLNYGVVLALFGATLHLGWSGFFNLPGEIWFWWTVEMTIVFVVGATVLGAVSQKLAPDS